MLSIENLTVHYGHALALENVSLSVLDKSYFKTGRPYNGLYYL
jgi:ABC-type branched-subunit amino acid transport system ATPase component